MHIVTSVTDIDSLHVMRYTSYNIDFTIIIYACTLYDTVYL